MIFKPWDCAQPDEWLPQSLRLCWGSGDSSGGGGGGNTGGGDWGSSGSYDASGFDAGGIGAWGGTAYDASYLGTGAGGGGDWGSFGDTSYAGFNASNPTFADVAGPNPGVTTGGGDWGSAGAFSAAGTGGGPAGAMFGAAQGAGAGLWGGGGDFYGESVTGPGGGAFSGDYGGGGGSYGGGGGGGGGGKGGGGGSFGSFGSGTLGGSNAIAAAPTGPTGSTFADSYGGGSVTGPSAGKGGSEAAPDAGPEAGPDAGPQTDPDAAPLGTPAAPEAEPEAQPEAAPEVSSTIAGGRETNFDYGPQAARGEPEAEPSHFGPESVTSQEGRQALSDLTQSALAPADVNWGAVFDAPSDPAYQNDRGPGPMGPIAEPGWFESLTEGLPGANPAWAQDIGKSLTDVNTWLAPQNQGVINYLGNLYDQATQPNWGSVFEGAAGPTTAYQQGTQDLSNLTQSALAPQDVNWGSVFEGAAPDSGINPGAEQTGVVEASPAISAFIPGGRETDFTGYESLPGGAISAFIPGGQETNFDYGPTATAQPAPTGQPTFDALPGGQPGAPTTTDDASTPGGDPALSGLPADATQGQQATQGQPAVAPAAGGQTFVTDAAVNATVNAVSVALDKAGVDPITQDAVTQAVYDAALNLASPADQANAAATAALQTGASPAQAAAIANATYNVAMAQSGFTPGQPGQQQQAPPGEQQPGAPEGEQTTSTTSAFIPGGLQTNFEYAPSQPAAPSLIDMAPAQPGQPQAQPSQQPGLTTMLPPPALTPPQAQPGVPMPQARPADAPQLPTTARYGPFTGLIDKGTAERADTAGKAADAGAGRAIPANPNTGMPGLSALNVPGGRTRQTDPVAIVTHYTSGKGYTIGALVSQMAKGGAGYNYAVDKDGKVYQLRPDDRTAGHVGSGKGNTGGIKNANSIGVSAIAENESDLTPAQIAAMKDVVAALGRQFGISPSDVRGHGVVSPNRREHVEGSTVAGWAHGLTSWKDAPTSRPPADIPVRTAQPAPAPPTQVAQPQPPAEVPAARPSPTMPLAPETRPPVDRPLADIPAPAPRGPNEFDIPVTPPVRNATVIANNILKQATAHLNTNSDTTALNAAGVVAARAMAAAGIPANLARSLMLKGAMDGAIANGYGPGGKNSTVMGFSIWGKVQSTITDSINAAMQGYQPARPGELQGPPSPAAPGRQGALPFGQQYADLSQSLGSVAPSGMTGRPGEIGSQQPMFSIPGLDRLSPIIAPPAPPAPPASLLHLAAGGRDAGQPPAIQGFPGRDYKEGETIGNPNLIIEDRGLGTSPPAPPTGLQDPNPDTPFAPAPPFAPDLPGEQRSERSASLLDFLQNFNPISTAEARGGRSQAGNLQAPRADPGTIQGRLSEARAPIVNELQTNQGLKNTLDLIVTGEVGSQGKAAVLGFLETAMNKVAAEASREGRAATGRDLLNYLNNRSYFPDTWGKIESGRIKGGALTDELLAAVAGGSNTTKGSTGNSSAKSEGSRFGGNPTNVTIGKEHYGVENYAHHAAWYNALGAPEAGRGIGSDFAAQPGMPAIAISPAPTMPMRGLAKGGHVAKDEPVVVGEEGPEVFVPDWSGTVVPHQPQPGKGKNVDRWPKIPASEYPGRYGGVEREIEWQTRAAQNPGQSLVDMIDSGRLPLNEANWRAMLNDPALIALGRSRTDDRREGIDPGAEQYGVFPPAPTAAAEPPDPTSPMAQALGYGSIKRRPLQVGRQTY